MKKKKQFDMKIIIDEDVCNKVGISPLNVLILLATKICHDMGSRLDKMKDMGLLSNVGNKYYFPTDNADELVAQILLDSDKSIPKEDELTGLAIKLKELFPRGSKVGTSLWRGNTRKVINNLRNFFKLYGNEYSHEDIINATKKYVDSFGDDKTYMRTLPYFILKFERKEQLDENGNNVLKIVETSDLANILENQDFEVSKQDWFGELI